MRAENILFENTGDVHWNIQMLVQTKQKKGGGRNLKIPIWHPFNTTAAVFGNGDDGSERCVRADDHGSAHHGGIRAGDSARLEALLKLRSEHRRRMFLSLDHIVWGGVLFLILSVNQRRYGR